jgi:RNA polymerase sigma-70 factor (ECF subfamily)
VEDLSREEEWAALMRAAILGDADAYRRFLQSVTPYLRALARRRCERVGVTPGDAEDLVQEVLLAIHLKRGTWDRSRPIMPWISAILRNKLIDSLRRRGHGIGAPIEEISTLEAADTTGPLETLDVERMLGKLKEQQRDIVRSISIDGMSISETAGRLHMTEGAVRVALHRALKALAAIYRRDLT